MKALRQPEPRWRPACAGQALMEFALTALVLATIVFGLIDLGRAIYTKQVITNLTREGSNLASRGTDLATTATTVVTAAAPLNLNTKGRVIITAVNNNAGAYRITGQVSQGGIVAASKIGTGVGAVATLPAMAVPIPQPSQTIYVTEVYYSYQAATPLGKLLNIVMPTTLYDVAYF